MSRVSNYVVISFSTVTNTFTNSHFEQKTLAVLKRDETCENMYKACGPLFSDIEQVFLTGEISVEGQVFNVILYLEGDMKFLQLTIGLSGSTSNYACAQV